MMNADAARVSASIGRHLLVVGLVAIVLVGGVGGWAMATSLASAVVASGQFVVASYVKTVQHSSVGIVGEILVHEGQRVAAGDVLMRLDATQTRAGLAIVTKRLNELAIRQARLEAERDDLPEIVFPPEVEGLIDDADVVAAMRNERNLFAFRRKARDGKKDQLLERVAQYENEISGLKAQATAYERGLGVLESELAGLRGLREKELVTIQRLNALDREAATLGGQHGEVLANQARAAGQIAETQLQILQIDYDYKSEVSTDLREVQAQTGEYIERRVAAEDDLNRIDIIAPQTGIVHQLAVHTVGGVISPGEPIMQIVPESDQLVLEARIAPQDIDQLSVGQNAILRLSAFNQRTTPELTGTISRIGADLTKDQVTGLAYYVVRIAVSPEEVTQLEDLVLVPGMPAEAFIQTGERTMISYLVKPLSDQISRALKEE